MLADSVEAKVLENLEVVDHSLKGRRRHKTIRPVALVESAELEDKLAVEEMAGHTLDLALGDGAEAGVALDLVLVSECDGEIVQDRAFGPPEFGVLDGEGESLISGAAAGCELRAILVPDGDRDSCAGAFRAVDVDGN